MRKILVCDCRLLLKEAEYEKAYRQVSSFRQKKADACKAKMDRARCIGAGLLLREAFFSCCREAGIDFAAKEPVQVLTCETEKPLVKENLELEAVYQELTECADAHGRSHLEGEGSLWKGRYLVPYVSISHSGDLAAVALSDEPIGLDIQKNRRFTEGMIRKVLSPWEQTEYETLTEKAKEAGDSFLLSLWCQKEAAAKLDGRGIFAMLSELSGDGWKENAGISVETIKVGDGYAGAIAYE